MAAMKRHTNEGGGSLNSKLARVAVMVSQHGSQQQQQQLNNQQDCRHHDQFEQPEQHQRQQPQQCNEGHNNNISGSDLSQRKARLGQKQDILQLEEESEVRFLSLDGVNRCEPTVELMQDLQRSKHCHQNVDDDELGSEHAQAEQGPAIGGENPKVRGDNKKVLKRQQLPQQEQEQPRTAEVPEQSSNSEHQIVTNQKPISDRSQRKEDNRRGDELRKNRTQQQCLHHVDEVQRAHQAEHARHREHQQQEREIIKEQADVEGFEGERFVGATRVAITTKEPTELCEAATVDSPAPPVFPAAGEANIGSSNRAEYASGGIMKTTMSGSGGAGDVGTENGDTSGCGTTSASTSIAAASASVRSGPQPQQTAQGEQQTTSTPEPASAMSASSDRIDGTSEETTRAVRERDLRDAKDSQQSESDGSRRKSDGSNTASVLYRDRLKLLPINCQEKLVFVVDNSVETSLPCGQFVDRSPACVLDALKKAMRLVASRRIGMNPSAQMGLIEWGRVPRWRLHLRPIPADQATLDALFDKLNPSTANEELCDFNFVLQTIKERTGLSMTWDRDSAPFVVRAIVFYCRPTPPLSLETSLAYGPSLTESAAGAGSHSASSDASRIHRPRFADLKHHPLLTLDAVFMLPKAACLKREPAAPAAPLTIPAEDEFKGARAQAQEKTDSIGHDDSATAGRSGLEQGQEVVTDADQKGAEVSEQELQQKPPPPQQQQQQQSQPASDGSVVVEDQAEENNRKNLHIEALQQAQSVIDWLHSLCTPSSYILPCAPAPLQILQQCCRLLGHPLQRPPQHLARHQLRPVSARPASRSGEKPEGGQQPLPQEQQDEEQHSSTPTGHNPMTMGGDRDSSTESSSTLSRPDDESMLADVSGRDAT